MIIPLYKAIVRPHLQYCIQAWNPHFRKDVDMLEKIQRIATKLIPELRDITYYEERVKECGLTTLETRRLRGDQIEVFIIIIKCMCSRCRRDEFTFVSLMPVHNVCRICIIIK